MREEGIEKGRIFGGNKGKDGIQKVIEKKN